MLWIQECHLLSSIAMSFMRMAALMCIYENVQRPERSALKTICPTVVTGLH